LKLISAYWFKNGIENQQFVVFVEG